MLEAYKTDRGRFAAYDLKVGDAITYLGCDVCILDTWFNGSNTVVLRVIRPTGRVVEYHVAATSMWAVTN